MAKVINLRTVRKQKDREKARLAGDQSAALHGRSLHDTKLQTRVAKALDLHLDRHKREPD